MRILVVDPHPVVHLGLETNLAKVFHSYELTVAHTGNEALKFVGAHGFDLVVLEIMLADRDGLEIVRRIRHQGLKMPILVFTQMDEGRYALIALRAGAQGIIHKSAPNEAVQKALSRVSAGQRFIGDLIMGQLAKEFQDGDLQSRLLSLTDREREIFIKLALGQSITSIADKLCLAYKTVYTHRMNILKKLKASDIQELTRYAFEKGMIPSRRVDDRQLLPD